VQIPSFYSARNFNLADIEGLSQRAVEMHLALYRGHVGEVNRLLGARAATASGAPSSRFAFEYNGMILHELFFESLTGALGAIPGREGVFHEAAQRSFGGIEAWHEDLRQIARTHGVGWAICARERAGNRLFNVWVEGHSVGLPAATDPVLVIDLWEHAWVTDYPLERRDEYIDTVLTQTDWSVVERRCR
jgi:Fe-Mn family superoxide dismutase